MGIHLLRCVHSNERTRTHDAIHDTFAAIAQNVGFHMGRKSFLRFLQPHSTPFIDESTLCLPKMAITP
jgi:hypothetical protein